MIRFLQVCSGEIPRNKMEKLEKPGTRRRKMPALFNYDDIEQPSKTAGTAPTATMVLEHPFALY